MLSLATGKYVGAAVDKINETYYLYRSYSEAIKDVDAIFGYATADELVKIIKADYGSDAAVVIDTDKVIVSAKTDTASSKSRSP